MAYILKLPFAAGLLIGILPVFLAGISEDISKKIPPFFRLGASIVSAVALVWVLSLQISAKGIPLLDTLFSIEIIALSITALAIALMAQSINIIDGLNGLSIGTSLIMTCAIAIIAAMNGDFALAEFSLFFGACLAGILSAVARKGRRRGQLSGIDQGTELEEAHSGRGTSDEL